MSLLTFASLTPSPLCLQQTTRALQLAGVIGLEGNRAVWTGGNTTLVQLGDILDRGDEEIGAASVRCVQAGKPRCA